MQEPLFTALTEHHKDHQIADLSIYTGSAEHNNMNGSYIVENMLMHSWKKYTVFYYIICGMLILP